MCPRPPRSITACDGTSASALNRNHQSSLMCKRKLGKEEEAPQRVAKQLLLQSWWVMMCLCCSAGIKAEVLSVEVAAAAACDWGCQPWTPQISTRWHRGDMAEPKSQTCSLLNLAACTVWKQFSCWMNDSSSKNMWLSKEVEEGKKMCFVRFIMLIKPRKPHSSVRIWLPNDCVTHFWECFVRKGRYGAKEGKRLSKTAKMWQNQEICEKGRNQAVRRYLGHAGFFFFVFFKNCLHNMQFVCYFGCPAAALLPGNPTPMKLCCDSLCRTCYYSPKATIWSFSIPYQQACKSHGLCSIFLDFVANWAEGLNQLNLSPVIIGDYEHLDILLFSITGTGGRLGSNYTAEGYLTYMVEFSPSQFSIQ